MYEITLPGVPLSQVTTESRLMGPVIVVSCDISWKSCGVIHRRTSGALEYSAAGLIDLRATALRSNEPQRLRLLRLLFESPTASRPFRPRLHSPNPGFELWTPAKRVTQNPSGPHILIWKLNETSKISTLNREPETGSSLKRCQDIHRYELYFPVTVHSPHEPLFLIVADEGRS